MARKPTPIPFPLSSFPGGNAQESQGRLINCYVEPLGEDKQGKYKWIGSAGLSQYATTANSGYRGGLAVNALSYECWSGNASTVDVNGNVTSIGSFPGTKQVSLARNQASPVPDVVAVDLDNGAYVLGSATVLAATVTVTIGGTIFASGDIVTLVILNPQLSGFPVSISYTLGAGETATTVATGLKNLINANTTLSGANVTAASASAVITISHQGSIGNLTSVVYGLGGTETPTTVNIGTQTSTAGATCALTGVTVPAGAIVCVCVIESGTGLGTVADSVNAGNYSSITSGNLAGLYYFANTASLSAATITYTKATSGDSVAMSAFYIKGGALSSVLDLAVTATAAGSSTSPSVTASGQAQASNELIVGVMGSGGAPTYTQASGFATPPNLVAVSTAATIAGGTKFSTQGSTPTFAPTLGTSQNWATIIVAFKPGTASETVTFVPASGNLTGGQGTYGAFTGTPTLYNGQGNLPQPNSVCFQDGYFFFTTGGGQMYATSLNGLLMNALTFVTVQSKADVNLLRAIAFSGLLLAFTTGSCEVWQDAANPAPNFPYGRIAVLEVGLVQATAIAGWETGFSELLWVGQDFGVHWLTSGSYSQIKASPPDLDRLIEAEIRAGNTLRAGAYIAGGKKFWTISSPDWTWELNLSTRKWSERQSLNSGLYGQWRGVGGHPAFSKWLVGDTQSGNLLYTDDTNQTDNGSPLLMRLESGLVTDFPEQLRVARADFNFVVGVGQAVGSVSTLVTGSVSGNGGVVRLTVISTSQMTTNDVAQVANVTGTTEANGNWSITVIDGTHVELQGVPFVNAYVSGGTVTDLTSPSNAQAPQVAISVSKNAGQSWGNPLLRPLGAQSKVTRSRVSVTNMGLSGPMGVRWRLDITDPVYRSFFGGSQSSEQHMVGP